MIVKDNGRRAVKIDAPKQTLKNSETSSWESHVKATAALAWWGVTSRTALEVSAAVGGMSNKRTEAGDKLRTKPQAREEEGGGRRRRRGRRRRGRRRRRRRRRRMRRRGRRRRRRRR